MKMPVSGLNHGLALSRNPPLQDLSFRAVQVVTKAFKVAKQELPAESDETKFSDDAFLDFQDVDAFLKFATAGSAFDFVDLHGQGKMR